MANQRNNSSTTPQQQQSSSSSIPQSLKLTDYLRPVFQEAFMIREYCLFTSIQHGDSPSDPERLLLPLNNSPPENEFSSLHHHQQPIKVLTGLYVIPSVQSSHLWFGLLSINNERSSTPSPWHGGVFRFIIKFQENYPSSIPTIQLLPVLPSPSNPNQFLPPQTHPDISPSTGQFNLRQYYSNNSNSSASSSSQQPKIYKILRSFRKSFYRNFADIPDPPTSINPSAAELGKRDYAEFLNNCAIEAGESLKWFKEVDSILTGTFKGDGNLVLLGENHGNGDTSGRNNARENSNNGKLLRRRAVGLSFL